MKEIPSGYQYDNYNYDYSSGDAGTYGEPHGSSTTEPQDFTVDSTSTTSASATEGAESLSTVPPEGAIAHGTGPEAAAPEAARPEEIVPAASGRSATEHNA